VYESVVKLLRRGLGEVGTQLVRRGGVVETALPGNHAAAHISTNKQSRGVGMNLPLVRDGWNARYRGTPARVVLPGCVVSEGADGWLAQAEERKEEVSRIAGRGCNLLQITASDWPGASHKRVTWKREGGLGVLSPQKGRAIITGRESKSGQHQTTSSTTMPPRLFIKPSGIYVF
jgi:hypothetical protein